MSAAIGQFKQVIEATQTDNGLMARLRADTFTRMYSTYNALGDHSNAEKCRDMAVKEQHKQRDHEAISPP